MTVQVKGGAVFLHVPKTGGVWVTRLLDHLGLMVRRFEHIHADASRVLRYWEGPRTLTEDLLVHVKSRVPLEFKKSVRKGLRMTGEERPDRTPFMFCFVRDPVTWYESYWRYQCDMGWPEYGSRFAIHNWHPCALLRGVGSADFNQFVRNVISARPGFVTEMYGWYVQPCVDFVGRQERLVDDMVAVLRQLGLDFDESAVRAFEHKNVSRGPAARIEWDPELREEVARLEYAGRRRFGYAT